MKALRIGLVGLLGAVAAFLAVVAYKAATAPPPPPTGVLVIALPGTWLLVLTIAASSAAACGNFVGNVAARVALSDGD